MTDNRSKYNKNHSSI